MTDNPTPPQSDEEQLVHVGWWCWRGNGHGHLATMACKSDNVPLHVPAEWADEMRAVIQRIEDGDDEDESPAPQPTAAPTVWVDGHPQLEAIAFAVWEKCERSDSGLTIDDPRNIALAALSAVQPLPTAPAGVGVSATPSHTDLRQRIAAAVRRQAETGNVRYEALTDAVLAVLPPPADRAAILREAADAVFALDYDDLVSEQDDENLGSMREAWDFGTIHASQLLRRLADEAQQQEPESGCAHCGGDHSWDDCQAYTAVVADAAAEPEPPVHGESVAHLAGIHGRRDQWADDEQPVVPVHAVPLPGSNGISACCGRPPCEFVGERVTRDPEEVTCTGPAVDARQDGAQDRG